MPERGTEIAGSQAHRSQQSNRELRHNIRNLTAAVQREGDDLADVNNLPRIGGVLEQLNSYHQQVEKPREQVEDSTCLMFITNKAADMAKHVARNGGQQQGPRDFVQILKHLYSGDQSDDPDPERFRWFDLLEVIGSCFKHAPGASCMLGPMEAEAKVRKAPQRRQPKQPLGQVQRAEEVAEQAGDKQDTDRHMEEIWTVLTRVKSTGFLELIMNHRSFSQTVENLFALSFLVRDVRVKLTESDMGLVVHINEQKKSARNETSEERDKMQFIIAFSIEDWEEWRHYVRPQDCLLAHRDEPLQPAGAPAATGRKRHAEDAGTASEPEEEVEAAAEDAGNSREEDAEESEGETQAPAARRGRPPTKKRTKR